MNTLSLSLKNIVAKPLSSILSILLFGFGVAMIIIILLSNTVLKKEINKNAGKIDLVVGAKGSPLQIILASIFQIDFPTGNISLKDAEKLSKNRLIASTIPLSMGDSYKGYRIIGTTKSYADHYKATLASGEWFEKEMTATIGAEIAKKFNLKIGDKIKSAHGLAEGGEAHEDRPFKVVGIMKKSNTVIDKLILIPIKSVWHVHEHHDDESKHPENNTNENHTNQKEAEHSNAEGHNDEHEHSSEDGHNHEHNDEHEHSSKDGHNHEHNDEHEHSSEDGHNHEHNDEHEHSSEDGHNHEHNDEHEHSSEDGHNHEHNDEHEHSSEDGHNHHGHNSEHEHTSVDGHNHESKPLIPLKKLGFSVTEEQLENEEITAIFIKYRSPMAAVQLPRAINKTSNLQAASPAYETARLFNIISVGVDVIKIVAGLIILLSAISVFIALINSLKERKYELAILRSMGASRMKIFGLILTEGVLLAIIGCLFGFIFSHLIFIYISQIMTGIESSGLLFVKSEWYILMSAILVGVIAAIIPATMAYKSDISKILSNA